MLLWNHCGKFAKENCPQYNQRLLTDQNNTAFDSVLLCADRYSGMLPTQWYQTQNRQCNKPTNESIGIICLRMKLIKWSAESLVSTVFSWTSQSTLVLASVNLHYWWYRKLHDLCRPRLLKMPYCYRNWFPCKNWLLHSAHIHCVIFWHLNLIKKSKHQCIIEE